MQLGGACIMWLAASEHAGTAGAARAGREEHIGELDPLAPELVEVGRLHLAIAVDADIVPADVVADDENDVHRLCRKGNEAGKKQSSQQKKTARHIYRD